MNKDGRLDILVALHDSYEVTFLLGDGQADLRLRPRLRCWRETARARTRMI